MSACTIRAITNSDLIACAALVASQSGRAAEDLARAYCRTLENPQSGYLVGAFDANDSLLGFARTVYLDAAAVMSARPVPVGWYLLGVNVIESERRRGIGRTLTDARMTWLRERANNVYYTASETNAASIALHRAFGFSEVGGRYEMKPGVTDLRLFTAQLS